MARRLPLVCLLQGRSEMRSSFLLMAVFTALGSGCATVADYQYTTINKIKAWACWQEAKSALPDDHVDRHFGKGYRAGFLDVTRGGDGTLPPVAPKDYWSAKYACGADECAVQQWYRGFMLGSSHALSCGLNHCYYVPSSNPDCQDELCSLEANQLLIGSKQQASLPHVAPTLAVPSDSHIIPQDSAQPPKNDAATDESSQTEQVSNLVPTPETVFPATTPEAAKPLATERLDAAE